MKLRIMCAIPVTQLGKEMLLTCALPPEVGIPAKGDVIEFWGKGKTVGVLAKEIERRYAPDVVIVTVRCSPLVVSTQAEAEDLRAAFPVDARVWGSEDDVGHVCNEDCS